MASPSVAKHGEFWLLCPSYLQRSVITMSRVALVRKWVQARCGVETTFLIERGAEKNRVLLRLPWEGLMLVAEVGQLYALRTKQPKAEAETVLSLFAAVA